MKLLDALRIYRETLAVRKADFQREFNDENGNLCYRDLLIYPTYPDATENFKKSYIFHHKNADYLSLVDQYKTLDLELAYFIFNTSKPDSVEIETNLNKY